MRRVTVADIMQETGLSRATVDRVLNGRGKVHDRTKQVVEETLRRLMAPERADVRRVPAADILLRVGTGMMGQMRQAWAAKGAPGAFHDLHMADETAVLRGIETLCRDLSRPLIVTVKNTDRIVAALAGARARGKRIVAMVSDLVPQARDAFVGVDDRAAGQTAAFLVGSALGDRPTMVGVVLGSSAFRNHEDREIGFRSALRAHFPRVVIGGEAQGEDAQESTRQSVLRLLKEAPALAAIYNVGGGNVGLVEALRTAGRENDVLVVGHEVNPVTAPLLRMGAMDFTIAGDAAAQLATALDLLADPAAPLTGVTRLLDFGVYTRFNLPSFAGLG